MECKDVLKVLAEYSDGALSDSISSEVANHISGCNTCGKELSILNATWKLLDSYKVIKPSHIFKKRVMSEINISNQRSKKMLRLVRFAVPLAAAAAVLVAVFFMSINGDNNEMLTPDEIAIVENPDILAEDDTAYEMADILDFIEDDELFETVDMLIDLEGEGS